MRSWWSYRHDARPGRFQVPAALRCRPAVAVQATPAQLPGSSAGGPAPGARRAPEPYLRPPPRTPRASSEGLFDPAVHRGLHVDRTAGQLVVASPVRLFTVVVLDRATGLWVGAGGRPPKRPNDSHQAIDAVGCGSSDPPRLADLDAGGVHPVHRAAAALMSATVSRPTATCGWSFGLRRPPWKRRWSTRRLDPAPASRPGVRRCGTLTARGAPRECWRRAW